MKHAPQVSFVVPCFNYERFLPDCLDSIFRQEGEWDFEVIVLDDGSTDETQAVLSRFGDTRLRVIRHAKNEGHVRTVTEGLLAARGDFVARIDADDRYRPGFLNEVVPRLLNCPRVGLVYGDATLIDVSGNETCPSSDRTHQGRDYQGNELVALLEYNIICMATAIARREAWVSSLPIPDHVTIDDWYLTVNIARNYEFSYVNKVVADCRIHGMSLHCRNVLDRSEERAILWVLDRVFNGVEQSPSLEEAKRRARRRIYGQNFLTLADKYFGFRMNTDARRCYLQAIRHQPFNLLKWGVQRRLGATFVSRERYEQSKALIRSVVARTSL